jgi:hypothetical protein
MQRNDTRPSLRGAKMMTFLLGLLLLPTMIVIATPRPTYAEGLLNKVGCLVGSLLDVNCAPPRKDQPDNTATPPASSPPAPAPATSQPIAIEPTLQAPLADAPPIAPASAPTSAVLGASVAYAVPTTSNLLRQPASGTGTGVPIEATGQGWRLFGILWYWWLIGALGAMTLFFTLKPLILKSLLSLSNR